MNAVINAFYMTMELWIFMALLGTALVVEEAVIRQHQRNELKQIMINLTVDKLHA